MMNIFADLVYFILKSNQIKTFYLLFRCEKTPKINFFVCFLFAHVYGESCYQPVSFPHILRSS